MNEIQVLCMVSATACAGVSPMRGWVSSRVMVSNTNGISAPWQAPSLWLASGVGESKREIQGEGGPGGGGGAATRMGGILKNQSVSTAARMSPGLAPGRLAR